MSSKCLQDQVTGPPLPLETQAQGAAGRPCCKEMEQNTPQLLGGEGMLAQQRLQRQELNTSTGKVLECIREAGSQLCLVPSPLQARSLLNPSQFLQPYLGVWEERHFQLNSEAQEWVSQCPR